jgi:hypothetical protein
MTILLIVMELGKFTLIPGKLEFNQADPHRSIPQ